MFAADPKITYTSDIIKGTGSRVDPSTLVSHVTGLPCLSNAPSVIFDYDQDGRDDIVSICQPTVVHVGRSLGDGNFTTASNPELQLDAVPYKWPYTPAFYDVNGDSLQDVVTCTGPSHLEVWLRRGPDQGFAPPITLDGRDLHLGTTPPQLEGLPFCVDMVSTHQSFDVDGDGTPELVVQYLPGEPEMAVYHAVPGMYALRYNPTVAPQLTWQSVDFQNAGQSIYGKDMLLGDMNGDGLNDVWRAGPGESTIWLNIAGGFAATSNPITGTTAAPNDTFMFQAWVDHNADGRLDVLQRWKSAASGSEYNLSLTPNSVGLAADAALASDLIFTSPDNHPVAGSFTNVGDLDGDEDPDLFGAGKTFYGSGLHNELLSKVTDGVGNTVHIRYDDAGTYAATCQDAKVWPEHCLKTHAGLGQLSHGRLCRSKRT